MKPRWLPHLRTFARASKRTPHQRCASTFIGLKPSSRVNPTGHTGSFLPWIIYDPRQFPPPFSFFFLSPFFSFFLRTESTDFAVGSEVTCQFFLLTRCEAHPEIKRTCRARNGVPETLSGLARTTIDSEKRDNFIKQISKERMNTPCSRFE